MLELHVWLLTSQYFQLPFSWRQHCRFPSKSAQLINAAIITSQKRFAFTNTTRDLRTSSCAYSIKRAHAFTVSLHTCLFSATGGWRWRVLNQTWIKIKPSYQDDTGPLTFCIPWINKYLFTSVTGGLMALSSLHTHTHTKSNVVRGFSRNSLAGTGWFCSLSPAFRNGK